MLHPPVGASLPVNAAGRIPAEAEVLPLVTLNGRLVKNLSSPCSSTTALTDGPGTSTLVLALGSIGVTLPRSVAVGAHGFSQPGAAPAEIYASISAVTMLP